MKAVVAVTLMLAATFVTSALWADLIFTRGITDAWANGSSHAVIRLVQSENRRDLGPPAPQLDPVESIKARIVEGTVLRIEGDHYIVKDADSVEVRFQVTKDTKMQGQRSFKVGDHIEARVFPDGHAASIGPKAKSTDAPAGKAR
jgi:hypothetical protein